MSTGWKLEGPCPCGRSKTFVGCCCGRNGTIRASQLNLQPPGPSSGYSREGCYLAKTMNCCPTLTGEHTFSAAILREMGEFVIVGSPWDPPETPVAYSEAALTSRVLCKRHNEALSPLDEAAARTYVALKRAALHAYVRPECEGTLHLLIDGHALELWAIKLMAGKQAADMFRFEGKKVPFPLGQSERTILDALTTGRVQTPSGLYAHRPIIPKTKLISVNGTPVVSHVDGHLVGMSLGVCGFWFTVVTDEAKEVTAARGWAGGYRPSHVRYSGVGKAQVTVAWRSYPRKNATHMVQGIPSESVGGADEVSSMIAPFNKVIRQPTIDRSRKKKASSKATDSV